jgi:hypothetical protein
MVFLSTQYKDDKNDSDQLGKFLQGLSAAIFLLNKATEKQSALECIVLQANIIDGMLRIGLILKEQILQKNAIINESLLKQEEEDKRLSERFIYKKCLVSGVIDQELFGELENAYLRRNKCIHRYLLCEINYDYATKLVFDLDSILEKTKLIIGKLENEQIEKGIGMTRSAQETSKSLLFRFASGKEKPYNIT